jgi:hypothetical protein
MSIQVHCVTAYTVDLLARGRDEPLRFMVSWCVSAIPGSADVKQVSYLGTGLDVGLQIARFPNSLSVEQSQSPRSRAGNRGLAES